MKRLFLLATFATAPMGMLIAQTANDVIIDRVQQPPPPTAPTAKEAAAAKDEKGDLDGGTQRLAETRKLPFKLTFGYDLQVYYTSNVFLAPNKPIDSVIVANTLATTAEFNSLAVGQTLMTPTVGLVYQRYNHALGSDDQLRQNLDFDAYSIPLALRVRYGNNWEFGLGVTATAVYSLEGPPSYGLTYKSITTAASARKLISLGQHQVLSFGGSIDYVKTDAAVPTGALGYRADRNDKIDANIDAGYYYIKDRWVFGPYARLTYSDYIHYQEAGFNDVNREDIVSSIGLSVSYNINSWAVARATTSYDWRKPEGNSFVDYSYKTANIGLGLSLSASF
ncbi:MAG TPA: hypothetical protein VL357_04480 [Rariglobus sp.]|jgi:hypothetical protein|nr:hypothetical protein [Rariglobus sp.]